MERRWTERRGLSDGIFAGSVVALCLGGLLVSVLFALSDFLHPSGLLDSFFAAERFMLYAFCGCVFRAIIVSVCERFGGMMCWAFAWFATAATVLLGVAVALVSLSWAPWSEPGIPRVLTAAAWVALPFACGTIPFWALATSKR